MTDIATKIEYRPNVEDLGLLPVSSHDSLTWLDARWSELVEALEGLGPVRVVTLNDVATHVKLGPFEDISFNGPVGLVLDEPIDLRLFTHHWEWAYATPEGIRIFDQYGRPMMRVDVIDGTDEHALSNLRDTFEVDAPDVEAQDVPEPAGIDDTTVGPDAVADFQQDWRAMTDTHEFFGLLRDHELDRAVAMRIGPPEKVTRVAPEVCSAVFSRAESDDVPIMVFVHSPGCVQIHTGSIWVDEQREGLMCIGGESFEMTVLPNEISEAWVVRKPTDDGDVTSIEFYDSRHELAFQVFGERKPGKAELPEWRELVEALAVELEGAASRA
jgi:putative hemin transport protein